MIAAKCAAFLFFAMHCAARGAPAVGFADPLQKYWTRPSEDRFSRLKADIEPRTPGQHRGRRFHLD